MFTTLCQELRELVDLEEECFSELSEEDWDPRRPRDRQLSQEYDPDNDDYEMRVIPEVNEIVELEESILIMNQIAKLENRIKMGGEPEILEHYTKVKKSLMMELKPEKLKQETKVRQDSDGYQTLSPISTCDTDLASLGS